MNQIPYCYSQERHTQQQHRRRIRAWSSRHDVVVVPINSSSGRHSIVVKRRKGLLYTTRRNLYHGVLLQRLWNTTTTTMMMMTMILSLLCSSQQPSMTSSSMTVTSSGSTSFSLSSTTLLPKPSFGVMALMYSPYSRMTFLTRTSITSSSSSSSSFVALTRSSSSTTTSSGGGRIIKRPPYPYGSFPHTTTSISSFWVQRKQQQQSSSSSSLIVLGMGKHGDGKKKRPKQKRDSEGSSISSSGGGAGLSSPSSSSSSSSSSNDVSKFPPRVTTNSLVPIRQQIQVGKLNKQLRDGIAGGSFRQAKVVRTKYRKQLDEDAIATKAEERKRKGQDPDWDVILNRTTADPLVMVDGYNIIYKWSRLKKHMVKGDAERARQLLIDDLEDLASLKRWRIECVFDGAGRKKFDSSPNNRGSILSGSSSSTTVTDADMAPTKTVTKHGVRTVFTGRGVEADTYIECRCAEAKNVTLGKITDSLIVATDDALIKIAAMNAGALCMSADRFVTELKAVRNSVTYRVEAAMAQINGESIRPEKLWGTDTFLPNYGFNNNNGRHRGPSKMEVIEERSDGSILYRYGHGPIIEDRRNRHKNKKNNQSLSATATTTVETETTTDTTVDHKLNGDTRREPTEDDDVQTSSSSTTS